jgi:hypothetical protein
MSHLTGGFSVGGSCVACLVKVALTGWKNVLCAYGAELQ